MVSKKKRQKLTRPQEARSESTSIKRLTHLAKQSTSLARLVARNPKASRPLLKKLSGHSDGQVRTAVAENPSTPQAIKRTLRRRLTGQSRRRVILQNTTKEQRDDAQALKRVLRRLAKKYADTPIYMPDSAFFEDKSGLTIGRAFRGFAECIGPSYYPIQEERSVAGIDRFGSSVGGLPYVTEEWPWPSSSGRPMAPWLQLDLDEVSELVRVRVGNGLLQLWRPSRGGAFIRRVPRREVKRRANLQPFPEQEKIASEWETNVVREGELEIPLNQRCNWTKREKYIFELQLWGLIWSIDKDDSWWADKRPWFVGGDISVNGPWQIEGWEFAELERPDDELLDVVAGYEEGDVDEEEFDSKAFCARYPGFLLWIENGRDAVALRSAIKRAGRGWTSSRPTAIRKPIRGGYTRDCLFAFPYSCDRGHDALCQGEFFAEGWKPMFTVSGPMESEYVSDRCIIYYRKLGRSFEYMPVPILER